MTDRRPVVVIVTKAPRIGAGKSRLAQTLGRVEARRINRGLNRLAVVSTKDPRWDAALSVSPDRATAWRLPDVWPQEVIRFAQRGGDLGARLERIAMRYRATVLVIIGSDCPGLTQRHIWRAINSARRVGVHLVPATDGGFVLLAARCGRLLFNAFGGVRWSSAQTMADLCVNLRARGQRVSTDAALSDVDTEADWRALMRPRAPAS